MNSTFTRLAALAAILIATTFGYSQGSTARTLPTRPAETAGKKVGQPRANVDSIQTDMRDALSVIEQNYVGGKKLDYNEVVKTSIDSMLHTLDPHSNYFDAKELEQFNNDQSSRYFGIGATIGDLSDAQGNVIATYIKATFEGAPANKAGLRYGDKIVSVNGESMLGKPFTEVRNKLRGSEGTPAKIVVERMGTGEKVTVDIVRAAVPQPSIQEAYLIRPGVGYIAMRGGFNRTTFGEFLGAMKDLKSKGAQQLILDLRDNGGGLVRQAYNVANWFLTNGQTVYTQKGRVEGVTERYPANNLSPDRSPIVMLVNRNTASASEILAGAMQDHDRALIVGETTFGKGLVQNPFPVDNGNAMLLLTIAKYETPSGRLIQRDYSNGDLYSYYTEGGSFRNDDNGGTPQAHGAESKTDTGRSVYSGGGINPDVVIKPETIPVERFRQQQKLNSPIFGFAMELVQGRVKGFESYAVSGPVRYDYDVRNSDFPFTEALFAAFKSFATDKYKFSSATIDQERTFINETLREELVTAAYGSTKLLQVRNEFDDQLLKAIDHLPEARVLASKADSVRNPASSARVQNLQ